MSRRIMLVAGIGGLVVVVGALVLYLFVIRGRPSPQLTVNNFLNAVNQGKYDEARALVCEDIDILPMPLTNFLSDLSYQPDAPGDKTAQGRVTAQVHFDMWGYTLRDDLDLEVTTQRENDKWCLTGDSAHQVIDQLFKPRVIVASFFNALNKNKTDAALDLVCETITLPPVPQDFIFNQHYETLDDAGGQIRVQVQAQARGQIGPFDIINIPAPILENMPTLVTPLLKTLNFVKISLKKNLDFVATTRHERGRWCITAESFWTQFVGSAIDPTR